MASQRLAACLVCVAVVCASVVSAARVPSNPNKLQVATHGTIEAHDVHIVEAESEVAKPAASGVSAIYNDRPIIGILSQPGDAAAPGESYISAGYVKWLEAAGARVIPIQYDLSHKELKRRFKLINGLLLPGGNYPLKPTTRWYDAGNLLFNLALEANRNGVHFPILGTCLGLQLLVTLISKDEYATSEVDAHNHPSTLSFKGHSSSSSAFLAAMPPNIIENFGAHPIAMFNHHYGLLPQALKDFPQLDAFYKITATTKDREGVKYAAIIEAKEFPFMGYAFHPEKVPYEWSLDVGIPHSRMAVDAAYFCAQAFVEQARRNNHRGIDIVEEDELAIYNWHPEFSGKHRNVEDVTFFEQVYIFEDDEA